MTKKDFSIEETLTFGWNTMKANFWFFVGVLIVAGLIFFIPRVIATMLQRESAGLSFLFNIIGWIADIIIAIGLITIALKFLDNKKPEFDDLFSFKPYFWQYLLGSILYGLIVMGGFFLFVIPGIYWAIKFQFFGYFIVDKKLDAIEALRYSSRLTKGVKWHLLGFGIVIWFIELLGLLALIIGLFAAVPIVLVAYAFVYRKLLNQTESIQIEETQVQPATTNV